MTPDLPCDDFTGPVCLIIYRLLPVKLSHLDPESLLLYLRQSGPIWASKAHLPAHFPVSCCIMSVGSRSATGNAHLSAELSALTPEGCACVSPGAVLGGTGRPLEPLCGWVERGFAGMRNGGVALILLVLLWGRSQCLLMGDKLSSTCYCLIFNIHLQVVFKFTVLVLLCIFTWYVQKNQNKKYKIKVFMRF